MFENKRDMIKSDVAEVLKKYGVSHDVSDDIDFNKLIERILVANSNDPSVQRFLNRG